MSLMTYIDPCPYCRGSVSHCGGWGRCDARPSPACPDCGSFSVRTGPMAAGATLIVCHDCQRANKEVDLCPR